jgi:hypothetical protein
MQFDKVFRLPDNAAAKLRQVLPKFLKLVEDEADDYAACRSRSSYVYKL